MGVSPGSRADPALVPNRVRPAGSAVAVLDFAVAQILGDDTALGALPAVLERVVAAFGLRAALALQPSAGTPSAVLAAYPADAADPALLSALSMATQIRHANDLARQAGPPVQGDSRRLIQVLDNLIGNAPGGR